MKKFRRIGVLFSLGFLASCSYFNTNDDLVVTSQDLEASEPAMDLYPTKADGVERIIYNDTDGRVAIYDLDVSEEEAERNLGVVHSPSNTTTSSGAVNMSKSVEVYPIDVSMQNTLQR